MSTHPTDSGPSTVCVRHPDRPTGLACTRCGRPACPDCLRNASVGMHCVDCVNEAARTTRTARTAGGAPVRRDTRPVVVATLIVLNLVVFALTAVSAGSIGSNYASTLFDALSLVPTAVADGQWWRLVTSGFLHIGPLHIAFNMIALWVIGRDVELALGRLRFTVVYLAALLGGSTAVMLFGGALTPVAGASGAVFGLMGALAVLLRRLKLSPGPALTTIAINVVLSFVIPGLSVLGHLGGLVVGALVAAGFLYGPGRSRVPAGFAIAGVVVVVLLRLVGVRDLALG